VLRLIAAAALAFASPIQDPPIPADTEIVELPSGLKYSVLKPGNGTDAPKAGDVVKVHYTGWLTTGKVFDSSKKRGQPFSFPLGAGQVIKGWDEGVALMSKGAVHKLTIPSDLAYGDAGRPPTIPEKATLIFEVELVDIVAMPQFRPGNPAAQKKTESGITYEPLREGQGAAPKADDVVKLRFAAWRGSGEMIHCTERDPSNTPVTAPLGDLPLPAFREAARVMRVGARYRFEMTAQQAWGDQLPRGMAPDTATVWEVELVEVKPPLPVPPFSLTPDDKLQKTASGLGYEVIREGTGRAPAKTDQVTVHYAGWLTDGKLFDASYQRAEPAKFRLNQVIRGWTEGLGLMKEGAIYKFTIPAELGYGDRGAPPNIPPGATLVFYVELLMVNG
jgi:peptidylprolyl isomerase